MIKMNNDIRLTLLQKRIIIIDEEIDDNIACRVVQDLLSLNDESSEKDIYLIINSYGGAITSGFAIYDAMKYVQCDINTICINHSSSMATILLSSGTKGKRYGMENSIINPALNMSSSENGINQILGKDSKRLMSIREKIINIMSLNTGLKIEKVKLLCEVTSMLSAKSAIKAGLIDNILDVNIKEKGTYSLDKVFLLKKLFEKRYYENIIKSLEKANIFYDKTT